MLLILISALIGGHLGLTRTGKVAAVITAGVLAASLHLLILSGAGFLLPQAADPEALRSLLARSGAGEEMFESVGAAAIAATVAGVLSSFGRKAEPGALYLPDAGVSRRQRRRRRRPDLAEGAPRAIGDLLNR